MTCFLAPVTPARETWRWSVSNHLSDRPNHQLRIPYCSWQLQEAGRVCLGERN